MVYIFFHCKQNFMIFKHSNMAFYAAPALLFTWVAQPSRLHCAAPLTTSVSKTVANCADWACCLMEQCGMTRRGLRMMDYRRKRQLALLNSVIFHFYTGLRMRLCYYIWRWNAVTLRGQPAWCRVCACVCVCLPSSADTTNNRNASPSWLHSFAETPFICPSDQISTVIFM